MPSVPTKNLWPHQTRVIAEVDRAIREGDRRPLVVIPTGGGKTYAAARMISNHVREGGRALFFAHREELVAQAHEAITAEGVGAGTITSSSTADLTQPVQIATLQTLLARGIRPSASLVIPDEAHHLQTGNEWSSILDAYQSSIIVGLTATPERADGSALSGFNRLIVGATTKELINGGFLVPFDHIRPAKALGGKKIAQRPVDAWLRHAKGRPTILFAAHTKAAEEFRDQFRAAGVRAEFLHYKMERPRGDVLDEYKRGQIDVLINLQIATEGFDHKPTSCVILARTVGSVSLYLQMIGRGLRSSYNKKDCVILDLCGQYHIHGAADEEREYSLTGQGIRRKGEILPHKFCVVCGAVVDAAASTCQECGSERSQLQLQTVTGDKLAKFAWIRKRDDVQRKVHYFKILDKANAAGHNINSAYYKYKGVYGCDPDRAWLYEWRKRHL